MNLNKDDTKARFMHTVQALIFLSEELLEAQSSITNFGKYVLNNEGKVTPGSMELWNVIMEHFETLTVQCTVASHAMELVLRDAKTATEGRLKRDNDKEVQ